MRASYGYADGSGEFYVTIDTDLCTSCGDCVEACPAGVLKMMVDDFDDEVATVAEDHRGKIRNSCAPCKPETGRPPLPCVAACEPEAITHSW